jgi:hypothetical protein
MTTVFLAGSRNLSRLADAVKDRLNNIMSQQFRIVIGDANGADKALQQHLASARYRDVVVHCSGNSCRNNLGNWDVASIVVPPGLKGRDFYTVKDRKMADEADYGFMIWDAKSPGTLNNIIELVNRHKKVLVYISPDRLFWTIASESDARNLLRRCDEEAVKALAAKIRHGDADEDAAAVGQTVLSF